MFLLLCLLLWQGKACHLLDTDDGKSGSLFLVFCQRVEMNQRTVSHSATVRWPLRSVMFPCYTLLCSAHSPFYFSQIQCCLGQHLIAGYDFAWADMDKKTSWHRAKYLVDCF